MTTISLSPVSLKLLMHSLKVSITSIGVESELVEMENKSLIAALIKCGIKITNANLYHGFMAWHKNNDTQSVLRCMLVVAKIFTQVYGLLSLKMSRYTVK